MFSHLVPESMRDFSGNFGSARTSQNMGLFPNRTDFCLPVGMTSWSCPRDHEKCLHPNTAIIVRTNKPSAMNATMRGGEPFEEKRSEMVASGSTVGVEELEAGVLVGMNESEEYV